MSERKHRGVSSHKDGGYVVYIGHKGKHVYLGLHRSFDAAVSARLEAEVRLFGSVFDRREPIRSGDEWQIPLHGHGGTFHGWAVVDASDFDAIKNIAWTVDARGYVVGRPPNSVRPVTLHSLLMQVDTGMVADHINGDRRDNRRKNLRVCSQKENARNAASKNALSGFKGVSCTPNGKWRARIMVDGKEVNLGRFVTKEEAGAAYNRAAIEHFGEYARLNDPLLAVRGEVS